MEGPNRSSPDSPSRSSPRSSPPRSPQSPTALGDQAGDADCVRANVMINGTPAWLFPERDFHRIRMLPQNVTQESLNTFGKTEILWYRIQMLHFMVEKLEVVLIHDYYGRLDIRFVEPKEYRQFFCHLNTYRHLNQFRLPNGDVGFEVRFSAKEDLLPNHVLQYLHRQARLQQQTRGRNR